MYRIAVDVEGVLADSQTFAYNIPDEDLPQYEMDSWGFSKDKYRDIFLQELTNAWKNKWRDIEPTSGMNKYAMNILNDFFTADIVTARTNADDEIKSWLEYNDIKYNKFISTKTYKEELNYDIYIDDNPYMANKDIKLYLIDRPWNKNIEVNNRVKSVMKACSHIILNYNYRL